MQPSMNQRIQGNARLSSRTREYGRSHSSPMSATASDQNQAVSRTEAARNSERVRNPCVRMKAATCEWRVHSCSSGRQMISPGFTGMSSYQFDAHRHALAAADADGGEAAAGAFLPQCG